MIIYPWWPILVGGVHAAGISTMFQLIFSRKLNPKQVLSAGIYGAGIVVAKRFVMLQWQNWLKRQLLYQMYLFSGTRLYSDIMWLRTTGASVSFQTGIYASASAAGGVLGAAVGIGVSQAIWGQSGREEAIKLYTGQVSFKEYKSKMKVLWDSLVDTAGTFGGPEIDFFDHPPTEFNYSFGPTAQEKQKSSDFPLGLNPIGGPIIV
tara:strand:+ start:1656 stop:2273 length:618 start_codon:yes stop_codon:yes gene_type:complete